MGFNGEQELIGCTNSNDYEIIQLRRTLKFLVDDIYSGTYSPKDLEKSVPLIMGLAGTIHEIGCCVNNFIE